MKHRLILFQISAAFALACIFFACSSTMENAQEDNFFEPITKNASRKSVSSQNAFAVEHSGVDISDSTSRELVLMFRRQNERLRDVNQQLRMMTKNDNAESSRNIEKFNDLITKRDTISNERFVEMVQEQNQQLNDVIEQLKLLSFSQQNNRERDTSYIGKAAVEPSPESFLSSPKQYDVSLGYGNAIKLYQQRKYIRALQSFQTLLDTGVDVDLQDNCHFWMGVCYFHLKKINKAISKFADVLNIIGSDKTEAAYFMIGQCHEQAGAKNYAKRVFEKMLRKYPEGSLKQMAEIKLALLK